jgi:hypothetical protein
LDADWAIKDVRFGKADEGTSSLALATIVERMQRECSLGADAPGPPEAWRIKVEMFDPRSEHEETRSSG